MSADTLTITLVVEWFVQILMNLCVMAGTLIGTYMSPELCCVYEMAILEACFQGKRHEFFDYSPELIELIRTMLSKKPEERPSAKTPKITLKNGDSKLKPVATVLSGKIELSNEVVHSQSHSSESSKTYKPMAIGPLKTPTSLKDHDYKPNISSTAESLALVQENQPRHSDASNKLEDKCNISQVKESLNNNTKSSNQVAGECVIGKQDRIHPGLQPYSSRSEPSLDPPHLLPSLPTVGKLDVISTQKDAESQSRVVTGSVRSSRSSPSVRKAPQRDSIQKTSMEQDRGDHMVIFHGKVAEEAEELHFKELYSAILPTDVIQGLCSQLLEHVYDIFEEDDELGREVYLHEHLGEKYVLHCESSPINDFLRKCEFLRIYLVCQSLTISKVFGLNKNKQTYNSDWRPFNILISCGSFFTREKKKKKVETE
ncbi:hypothetical protein FD755_019537 [Muntiacus reevesi]|uniref:non-specific serine/threonine protein kinase n=1 Tax=Muntiacus reevesi TaxID=9886 RepID=A0A5N3X309_MUNRE|nr:hypothetical protein FD755_019537 [Muntiacus reevesi]